MQTIKINNRRYIWSKTNLLENINSVIEQYFWNKDFVFADPFSWTWVVANYYSEKWHKVIANDLLYSNYVAYQTWMWNDPYNLDKIIDILKQFTSIDSHKLEENYFSDKFADKYFERSDAKKIWYIREELEKIRKEITPREYYILLTSLLYETDKIANTCWHFESFLRKTPVERGVNLRLPEIKENCWKNEIYCKDANQLVREITSDITYIDPPYNARQYVNFYHVLENLALWQKPEELEWNSMKFKRNHLKSDYSKSKAPDVFADLIQNISSKLIIVSYNNTYDARSWASNNKITEDQILSSLAVKWKISKQEIDYKFFNAWKTDLKNHKELLFICEVK